MTKQCNKCNKELDLSEFAIQKLGKDGRRASCKKCVRDMYVRSKEGIVRAMHHNQISKSKKRGHTPPNYTQKELIEWCMSQELFHTLYDNWKNSNYLMSLKPTCDRLDDYSPYSFNNIQLMTYEDNTSKYFKDLEEGTNTKRCKAVICLSLEGKFIKEYHSIAAAARDVNTSVSNIRNVCEKTPVRRYTAKGSYRYYTPRTSMGFIWKYKEA